MSSYSDLEALWTASANTPHEPAIGKETQLTVGFTLLLLAFLFTGLFGLNSKNLASLPMYGVPASLAFGFGAVYMICAVGVYV
ncbi:hypothetical protein MBLNU230_g8265t1 [Neophaeotheca triangularis]